MNHPDETPDEITHREPEPDRRKLGIPAADPAYSHQPALPDYNATPERVPGLFFGPGGVRAGWRAAMFLALFALFLSGLQILAAQFHTALTMAGVQPVPNVLLLWEFLSLLCALAATALMAKIEGRRFSDYGMPWSGALRGRFWKGAAWGIAQVSVLILGIAALGGYSFGERAIGFVDVIRLGLYWAIFFLVVGVFEEFFFRGYLQVTLASGMGFWPGAILLSLVFAGVHLSNPGESFAGIPDLVAIALFLCLTLRRTGDLWFAIGFHAAFDFGETYLYSVPDSGLVAPGHLSYASLHGPDWLTGGAIGPEGSVLSVAIVLVTFALFARVYPSNRSSKERPLPMAHPGAPLPAFVQELPAENKLPSQDAIPPPPE